jgi:ABC-type multidrug transport system fused ATPase/permease subunit
MINSVKLNWTRGVLRQSVNVLSKKDQRKIILVIVIQIMMGLLDLLGVAIFGVLGALAVSGVQSSAPGNRVMAIISFLHLSSYTFQEQAAILGIIATVILVSRTLFSVIFTRRTLFFLSRRGAVISTNLVSRLLAQPLLKIQERSTQDSVYAVTNGVNAITLGVLGAGVLLISDLSLLLVMSAGLFLVQPVIALSSILAFSLIGFLIYKLMHRRAQELGQEESLLSIESSQAIIEVLSSYREAVVRNRRDFYARKIGEMRWRNANILAELSFMPNISKYVIETTVVIAALVISAAQFIIQDAAHAIATLTIFLAAGTRIAPAVLRVQQGALQIRSSLGVAAPTLSLISDLESIKPLPRVEDITHVDHSDFDGTIILDNITLTYPGKPTPALESINLKIESGSSVAFVGPSGAGKTSIVDVILGVLVQDSGTVTISGKNPLSAIESWPGAIGYVPQDVIITSGTFRENVALGYPVKIASDALVNEAIQVAQLSEFIATFPTGVDTQVGERGAKISGGQRQRLGIARAMFTKPKLLVLDEATSALDGETEANISDAISSLKGSVTVVLIAHRLSTVRHADLVVYLEDGKILAQGSFEEVRSRVPGFDRQAQLMGL